MTRTTATPPAKVFLAGALGAALLAAGPAVAQRGVAADGGATAPMSSAAAEADRLHKGNGASGGPAELLRMAQAAMRRGQTVQANELLERAETRLLRGDPTARPDAGGEPARHVSEARRALQNRDRAEAMRHTNLAIATTRDEDATGTDLGGRSGAEGGGRGAIDSGMGTLPTAGAAVLRDRGTGATNTSRAEGIVLAQSGAGTATGNSRLPPGDTIPGWSGPRGGTAPGGAWGGTAPPPPSAAPGPGGAANAPAIGDNTRGGLGLYGAPNTGAGPGSAGMLGGEPARIGGAPPGDTSRAPGSSGLSGAGVGGSAVGGPLR